MRKVATLWALALAACVGSAVGAQGTSGASMATLELGAKLNVTSRLGPCPPGVSEDACGSRTGSGLVPGIGRVTEAYTFVADLGAPSCADSALGKALGQSVAWIVAGKGEIHLTLLVAANCVDQDAVRTQQQSFVVAGGTGSYLGASGGGSLSRTLGEDSGNGRSGTETWAGTLVVPGLEFDLTAPTLAGATNRTVLAPRGTKSARVRFKVTAQDETDGATMVACMPRSGSRFRLGKTRVTCSSVDTSANATSASFRVTVRARR